MEYTINFQAPVSKLSSEQFHALTKNGPYLDAHFGALTSKTPVGETYYARPLSESYCPCVNKTKQGCGCGGKGNGELKIQIKDCIPFIHAQTNTVTNDIKMSGIIKISPFSWEGNVAKIYPDQIIDVNIKVQNFTNLPMQGFHIHDGVNKSGMTAFGPISYFLYTTPAWQKRFNMSKESKEFSKKFSPLPSTNTAIADTKTLLDYCNSINIKKI
jgi:hypothetical protein